MRAEKKVFYGIVPEDRIKAGELMKNHTTFQVGGAADLFLEVEDARELAGILEKCREYSMDFYIIGNGSNVLFSDEGFRGVVIKIGKDMGDIRVEGSRIVARAGAPMSQIAARARESGLEGFEFAAGIPGTIGGGSVMNAGAYGGELKDVIEQVSVMDSRGAVEVWKAFKMDMDYRTSAMAKRGMVVLEAVISLRPGDKEEIRRRMEDFQERRLRKQPLEYPSAGSTFKRPRGYFAGKLIEDAGLRGYTLGGAQVSEKHCGFIINKGGATAGDIYRIMEEVIRRVRENSGVTLEPEVKRIGVF